MSIFNNNSGTPTKRIKWVVEYKVNGKQDKIVDYFSTNLWKDSTEARKYLERKLGTFQFTIISVREY